MTIRRHKDAFLGAAGDGLVDVVRESLRKNLCGVDCQDDRGMTALMIAATNGHRHVVDALVAHNCKLDVRSNYGATALMWAAEKGHKDIVDALVAHNCKLDLQAKKGETALMWGDF